MVSSARCPHRGQVIIDCKDRKSTRLNSSHLVISYAVFCLKKKSHPSIATRTSTQSAHVSGVVATLREWLRSHLAPSVGRPRPEHPTHCDLVTVASNIRHAP